MKNYLLVLFLLLTVCTAKTQVVTGVYKGKMEVDSPKYTVDFELTLKEKDGKLVGYCQRLFIVEDVLYYNLVKVTARIADSVLIVEDEKSVSNNFKEKTSGVKTVMFFKIQTDHDTVSVMPGEWSTSRTKKFLPITGSVSVSRERNYLATQLYKRLDEKQLGKEMLFEEKVQPQTSIAATQPDQTKKPQTEPETKRTDVAVTSAKPNQPQPIKDTAQKTTGAPVNNSIQTKPADIAVQQKQPAINQPQSGKDTVNTTGSTTVKNTNKPNPTDIALQNKPTIPAPAIQQQSAAIKDSVKTTTTASTVNKPSVNATNVAVTQNKPVPTQPTTTKPVTTTKNPSQQSATTTNPQQQKPTTTAVTNKPPVTGNGQQQPATVNTKPETKPADQKPNTPVAPVQQPSTISTVGNTIVQHNTTQPTGPSKQPVINNPVIVKRQTEIIDALELSGDSITLSLYDNGEIDGDTVSVFVNNELVVSKVGLKASAYKKTIAIQPGEVIQLTLFAENLGSIPPNTGLLVITTNNERYQIHFSSTLNKNSSVVLRRKE
jgi:hypothetical protein